MPFIDTRKRRGDFALGDEVYSWDGRVGLKPLGRSGSAGIITNLSERCARVQWSDMPCWIIYSHLTHEPELPANAAAIMTNEARKHIRLRDPEVVMKTSNVTVRLSKKSERKIRIGDHVFHPNARRLGSIVKKGKGARSGKVQVRFPFTTSSKELWWLVEKNCIPVDLELKGYAPTRKGLKGRLR